MLSGLFLYGSKSYDVLWLAVFAKIYSMIRQNLCEQRAIKKDWRHMFNSLLSCCGGLVISRMQLDSISYFSSIFMGKFRLNRKVNKIFQWMKCYNNCDFSGKFFRVCVIRCSPCLVLTLYGKKITHGHSPWDCQEYFFGVSVITSGRREIASYV